MNADISATGQIPERAASSAVPMSQEIATPQVTHARPSGQQRHTATARHARVSAYLRSVRIENCVLSAALTAIGAGSAVSDGPHTLSRAVLACVVVFLVVASGNAANDFYDETIDRFRRPNRPLPSGLVSAKEAIAVSHACAVAAMSFAAFLGFWDTTFVAAMVGLAFLCSSLLKGIPALGNISMHAPLTVVFGSWTIGVPIWTTGFIASLIFMAMLLFEVLEDHRGWVCRQRRRRSPNNRLRCP